MIGGRSATLQQLTRWLKLNPIKTQSLMAQLAEKRSVIIALLLTIQYIVFSVSASHFLDQGNLTSILYSSINLAVIALGMAFVLTMGSIDVSVGSVQGVAAIAVGRAVQFGWSPITAVLAGPAVGALFGATIGSFVSRIKLPAIIVTLAMLYIGRAIIFFAVGGEWISGLPDTLSFLKETYLFNVIPLPLILLVAIYLGGWYIMRMHPFGRHIHAVGSGGSTARLAGISVHRVQILTHTLTGLLVGLAATWYVALYQNVEINIGITIFLDAIVATVLGGTSVLGGKSNIIGTLLSVFFIATLRNGLVLISVPSLWVDVILGVLLISVLVTEFYQYKLRVRSQYT